MKTCTKCKIEKPLDCFPPNKRVASGLSPWCRPCAVAASSAWQQKNAERLRTYRREWRLLSVYGLTQADFDALLAEQGGVCAVCLGESGDPGLCVDHDHRTNAVRGILCRTCNLFIGKAGDDADRLQRAADYLRLAAA